jgi:hypothetical protein
VTPTARKPGLFINRNFGLLWLGQTISIMGDFAFSITLVVWIYTALAKGQPWAPLAKGFPSPSGRLEFYSEEELTKIVRALQQAIDPSPQNRKTQLEQEISELENSLFRRGSGRLWRGIYS